MTQEELEIRQRYSRAALAGDSEEMALASVELERVSPKVHSDENWSDMKVFDREECVECEDCREDMSDSDWERWLTDKIEKRRNDYGFWVTEEQADRGEIE